MNEEKYRRDFNKNNKNKNKIKNIDGEREEIEKEFLTFDWKINTKILKNNGINLV